MGALVVVTEADEDFPLGEISVQQHLLEVEPERDAHVEAPCKERKPDRLDAAAGLNVVQRAGRAESRFGGLVEYCSTEPASIRAAVERASDGTRGEALQQYVRKFSWNTIADDYRRAIEVIPLDRTDHPRV